MSITDHDALTRAIDHREIFHDEMLAVVRRIMSGDMSPVMMAAMLVGLRVKKETIGEITAAAQVMREFATKVDVPDKTHLVDIVGTGGDGSHTFNISTCSMFVAAAAGARVSKHGNRSVSSKSGSADVLEAMGVRLNLSPAAIAQCIAETGIGFMFAPMSVSKLPIWLVSSRKRLPQMSQPSNKPNKKAGTTIEGFLTMRQSRCFCTLVT